MNRTCEKCIHYDVCRYPLEHRAFPDTCWKYEEERPYGHWVYGRCLDGSEYCHCSECGESALYDSYGNHEESDCCPNCGSDMRKEGEQE